MSVIPDGWYVYEFAVGFITRWWGWELHGFERFFTFIHKEIVMNVKKFAAESRKAIVGAVGIIGEVAAANVLHGTAQHVAEGIVAVATAFGIYQVPNRPQAANQAAPPAVPPPPAGTGTETPS